ncbi:ap1-like basic-leucine zipper transcription factor [Trichoderma arundinaceum]|uniref:Ap1-like basic-leucine zipper transcription factor n=1 Tax=Trichoderma arundinaceum TaxID=490622 RepID=A0A395NNT0_TRIAR|nr:ap1-like basic-leucine zipper transcription factor [Trichoderma arundinaceum]
MEHAEAFTADTEWSGDEIHNDRSDSGASAKRRTATKTPQGVPQKLKTSERRRIQNRQAQKTYREKQKRRLQALESFAKSQTAVAQDVAASSTPASTLGPEMAGMLDVNSPIMAFSGLMQHQDLGPPPGTGMGSHTSYSSNLDTAPLGYQTSGSVPFYRLAPSIDYQADGALHASRSFREDLFSTSTPLVTLSGSDAITPGSGGFDSPYVQQGPSQPHNSIVTNGQTAEENEADDLLAHFLLQDDITLSKGLLRDIRKNKITLRDVLRIGLQSLEMDSRSTGGSLRVTASSIQQRAHLQLPDLHTNTLRLTQMSFVSALLYNATMLGITAPEMFAHDTESHFCTSRRASGATEDAAQHVTLVDIKEDLKPTQNQLTHCHHPYIDTLPFRVFRERLIALINAQPSIINMAELCHDLQNDGVICWGSSAGAGTGHSGAPWDIRSWEVRPWFLKKWWMITEGADGEMYRQARWWCEMRGEDMPTLW